MKLKPLFVLSAATAAFALAACDNKPADAPAPKVEEVEPGKTKWGAGKMLISCPADVEKEVAKIVKGSVLTMGELRNKLAQAHGADFTCPLTTGIFMKIIAFAAEDDRAAGREPSPYWRVVRDDWSLNEKYPGGIERQEAFLRAEGIEILVSRHKKRAKLS